MFSNVLSDAELVDSARDAVAPLRAYLDEAAEILAGALRHALAFSTWRSLTASGITRADATVLVTALVEAAATPRSYIRLATAAAGLSS